MLAPFRFEIIRADYVWAFAWFMMHRLFANNSSFCFIHSAKTFRTFYLVIYLLFITLISYRQELRTTLSACISCAPSSLLLASVCRWISTFAHRSAFYLRFASDKPDPVTAFATQLPMSTMIRFLLQPTKSYPGQPLTHFYPCTSV